MTEGNEDSSVDNPICPAATDRNPGTTTHHRIIAKNNNNEKTDTAINDTNTEEFVPQIRWPDSIAQIFLHTGCLYGLYLCFVSAKFYTTLFGKLYSSKFIDENENVWDSKSFPLASN